MTLQNLSSRVKTQGSDIDMIMWLSSFSWDIAKVLFSSRMTDGQIPFSFKVFGLEIDLYLTPKAIPPRRAMIALLSYEIQQAWDNDTLACYTRDKEMTVARLQGKERKLAKVALAQEYGLPTYHYRASMGA